MKIIASHLGKYHLVKQTRRMTEQFLEKTRHDEGVVRAPQLRNNAVVSRKCPPSLAYRVAASLKPSSKSFGWFDFRSGMIAMG